MAFSPSANDVGTQACAQACLIAMALRSACITSWHPQNSIPARKPKNASSAPRPIAIVQCNSLGHPLVKRHGTRGVIIPVNLKEIPPGDHWAFSYRILAKVSRSFFLVIQELPPELRNTVRSPCSAPFSQFYCLTSDFNRRMDTITREFSGFFSEITGSFGCIKRIKTEA